MEGRGCRVVEPIEGKMTKTKDLETISTKLERIGA
jgi:hypothetical protein